MKCGNTQTSGAHDKAAPSCVHYVCRIHCIYATYVMCLDFLARTHDVSRAGAHVHRALGACAYTCMRTHVRMAHCVLVCTHALNTVIKFHKLNPAIVSTERQASSRGDPDPERATGTTQK